MARSKTGTFLYWLLHSLSYDIILIQHVTSGKQYTCERVRVKKTNNILVLLLKWFWPHRSPERVLETLKDPLRTL